MTDIAQLQIDNAARWDRAVVTADLGAVPARLVAAKGEYLAVERRTGVPWWVVAVIHQREGNQDFSTSLAQGDPWNEVSQHVPAGRGPFASWEDAAIDALVNCSPYLAHQTWTNVGATLTNLERYNGLGYAIGPVTYRNGVVVQRYAPQPSPYLWAGTNQYQSGKYVADHVYSPTAIDRQIGCAALVLGMMKLDSSIQIPGSDRIAMDDPAPGAPASWWSRVTGWLTGARPV